MKNLSRNKKDVWYALLKDKTEILDGTRRTGQYRLNYEQPVKTRMNIRWDSGAVRMEGFGLNGAGKRRLVTDDMNCPITLGTILWIGKEPDYPDNTAIVGIAEVGNASVGNMNRLTDKPNYYVCEVPQRSLNQIAFVVEEVNVS